MSQVETIIRYDGPALAGHDMDVEELAPALLALASLIQAANHKFNGDMSAVKVTVNADIDQKCFQIKVKFAHDILQMAKSFLDGDMATLKDICEWIGIGISGATGTWTLFKALVFLGKQQHDSTEFNTTQGEGSIAFNIKELHFHGPMPPQVQELLADPEIVAKAQAVFKPVTHNGYESLGFYKPSGEQVFKANKEEAAAVVALPAPANENSPTPLDESDEDHKIIETVVKVTTQINEGKAQWRLKWAARSEFASMHDLEWLEKFQTGQIPVTVPLYLKVRMNMVTSTTNPDASAQFEVLKVLEVLDNGGGEQSDFLK